MKIETKILNFEKYLISLNIKKLIFFYFLIIIFKVGIWYHPALWKHLEISINPFNEILLNNVLAHYLYYNFLGVYIADLLNFSTKLSFFIYHLFFSFVFNLTFIYIVFKNLEKRNAVYSLILFLIFPVSTTVFFWVGYDSIMLSLIILSILFRSNYFLVFIFGVLLGLQHFEIGFLSALTLFTLNIYNKYFSKKSFLNLKFSIFLLVGVIIGKIILTIYFNHIGIELNSGRTWYVITKSKHFLYNSFFNFYVILWFSLSLGWIVVIRYIFYSNKNNFFVFLLFGQFLIILIVDDQTRVFAGLSFLILLSQIFLNEDFLKEIKTQEIVLLLALWILMPYGWVWQGVLRSSMFMYDFSYVINFFFNIFNDPSIKSSIIWPFKTLR